MPRNIALIEDEPEFVDRLVPKLAQGNRFGTTLSRRTEITIPIGQGKGWRPRILGAPEPQETEASTFAEVLDGLAVGVFVIDARGTLLHVNASGRAMLTAGDPLKLARGALFAAGHDAHRTLTKVVASASSGDRAPATDGIDVPLIGREGDRFVVHVRRLNSAPRDRTGVTAAAALFVRKAIVDLVAAISAAAQLYALTPAEARVLRLLIEVGGIASIASIIGASRSTVKTHVGHLFEKTGSRRQADLVKLIAGLGSPARALSPPHRSRGCECMQRGEPADPHASRDHAPFVSGHLVSRAFAKP